MDRPDILRNSSWLDFLKIKHFPMGADRMCVFKRCVHINVVGMSASKEVATVMVLGFEIKKHVTGYLYGKHIS